MRTFGPLFATVLFSLVLLACGGGGKSSPGTSIHVSPASLTFDAPLNGPVPAPQTLTFSYAGDGCVVGYPTGVPTPSWMSAQLISYTASGGAVSVAINGTNLAPGSYSTTLRFVSGHKDGTALVTQDVPITFVVSAVFSVDRSSVAFVSSEQVAPPVQWLNIDFDGLPFDWRLEIAQDGSKPADWLSLSVQSGSSAGNPVAVQVMAAPRPEGSYSAFLDLKTGNGGEAQRIPITYNVGSALSLDRAAIAFTTRDQVAPDPVVLDVVSAGEPFSWSLEVVPLDANPCDWVSLSSQGGTSTSLSVPVTVTAAARSGGTYYATLVLKDGTGAEVQRLPVTCTVASGYTLSQAPSFTVTQASDASALSAGFDLVSAWSPAHGAGLTWTLASDQPWLTVSPASGTMAASTHLTALLDPAKLWTLASGTYAAHLTLTVSGGVAPAQLTVPLALTLEPALQLQGSAAFALDNASTDATLAGQLTVTDNLGSAFARSAPWTATSSVPWLLLTTASGTTATGNQLAFKVDKTALAGLATPASATLTVAGTAPMASASATIPVTTNFGKPAFVSPYVAWTGSTQKEIVRGTGFNGITQVQVGGVQVPAQVVDDTELHFTAPAFASAQRAKVRFANVLGQDLGGPELVVNDPPACTEADLPCPGASQFVLDPERNAVLAYGWGATQLTRHRFLNGAWTSDALPVAGPCGLGVAPDGKELLLMTGGLNTPNLASHLDPATLVMRAYDAVPSFYALFGLVAEWNDGACWLLNTDQWASVIVYPQLQTLQDFGLVFDVSEAMTLDGSLMILGSSGGISPGMPNVSSVTANGKVVTPRTLYDGNFSAVQAGLGRDGSRFVHTTSVYDAAFNRLGTLTPETWIRTLAVAPDCSFAVAYGLSGTQDMAFRRHPLTAAAGPYPADTTLDVTLPAGAVPQILAISQDGGTLFILYDDSSQNVFLKVFPLR